MSEFEHKRTVRRVLMSPIALIFLFVVLCFLVRGVWDIYLKKRASVVELNSAKERLVKLQTRQEALVASTQKLSTESGVEYEIRDRLQMAKVGERQIVIVEGPETTNSVTPVSRNFLQKIVDFFTIR